MANIALRIVDLSLLMHETHCPSSIFWRFFAAIFELPRQSLR
jgi:hypothetical protein